MNTWLLASGQALIPKAGGGNTALYAGSILFMDEWATPEGLGGSWESFTVQRAAQINPPAGKASFICVSRAGGVRKPNGDPVTVGPGSIVIIDTGINIPLSAGAWISVPFV